MSENLKINISADVKQLRSAMNSAKKALTDFESQAESLQSQLQQNVLQQTKLSNSVELLERKYKSGAISLDRYQRSLMLFNQRKTQLTGTNKMLSGQLTKTSQNIRLFGGTTSTMTKRVADGNVALLSFSRLVQDAPFGIMGMSNNITDLTEQFGRLKQKTGSSRSAIGLMIKSLRGAGGLGLAVSVITSALVMFGDRLFSSKKKTEDLTEATKDQNKALKSQSKIFDDLISKMDVFEQAKKAGVFTTIKEREQLKQLVSIAGDVGLSDEKRINALKRLQSEYGKYFAGLKITDENKLIKAQMQSLKVLRRKEKLKRIENELEKTGQKLYNARLELQKIGDSKNIDDLNRKKQLMIDITNLMGDQTKLSNAMGALLTFDLDLKADPEKIAKKAKAVVSVAKMAMAQIDDEDKLSFDSLFKDAKIETPAVSDALIRMREDFANFISYMDSVVSTSFANTFESIGDIIAKGMAGGVIGLTDVVNALKAQFGEILSNMGSYLIRAGSASVMAGKIAKFFGDPKKGIKFGLAGIALGVALKGLGGALKSQAMGTGVAGGSDYGSSDRNMNTSRQLQPSYYNDGFSSGYAGQQQVVFEIAGTKLVGVLTNTLRSNRNLGGSIKLTD